MSFVKRLPIQPHALLAAAAKAGVEPVSCGTVPGRGVDDEPRLYSDYGGLVRFVTRAVHLSEGGDSLRDAECSRVVLGEPTEYEFLARELRAAKIIL